MSAIICTHRVDKMKLWYLTEEFSFCNRKYNDQFAAVANARGVIRTRRENERS